MTPSRNTLWLIGGIALLLSMLLGAISGAMAGGLVGYLAGRQAQEAPEELAVHVEELEQALRETHARMEEMAGQVEAMRRYIEEGPMPGRPYGEEPGPMPSPMMGPGGALVQEVLPDTPAEEAGLRPGDLIVAVNEEPVTPERPLPDILGGYRPGDRVELTLLRRNETLVLSVRLGRHPDDPERGYLGVRILNLVPQEWPDR